MKSRWLAGEVQCTNKKIQAVAVRFKQSNELTGDDNPAWTK